MKIGVVSDSHGDVYAVRRALKLIDDADIVIHLGDYCRDAERVSRELNRDIIYVKGNCDFTPGVDCDKMIAPENKKIFITHGHNYNVKWDYDDLYFKAVEVEADIVLFGHTHFPEIFERDGILFINPGSLSRPRGPVETYAVIRIDSGIVTPNIMELE